MDAEVVTKCSESTEEGILRWTLWGFRSGVDTVDDAVTRQISFPPLLQ